MTDDHGGARLHAAGRRPRWSMAPRGRQTADHGRPRVAPCLRFSPSPLLLLLFLLLAGQVWGATVYVSPDTGNDPTEPYCVVCYKSGAWPTVGVDTCNTDIDAAELAAGNDGTVIIDGGTDGYTYETTALDAGPAGIVVARSGMTICGSTEAGHDGTVTLDGSGVDDELIDVAGRDGVTLYNLTLIGHDSQEIIYNDYANTADDSLTVYDCTLRSGQRGIRTRECDLTVYRNRFQYQAQDSIYTYDNDDSKWTFDWYSNVFEGCSHDMVGKGTIYILCSNSDDSTYNIHNNTFLGCGRHVLYRKNNCTPSGDAPTINFKNNLITGAERPPSSDTGRLIVVDDDDDAHVVVNVQNNLLQCPWYDADAAQATIVENADTDSGNIGHSTTGDFRAKFTQAKYPGAIMVCVDDYGSIFDGDDTFTSDFESLLAAADSSGIPLTIFPSNIDGIGDQVGGGDSEWDLLDDFLDSSQHSGVQHEVGIHDSTKFTVATGPHTAAGSSATVLTDASENWASTDWTTACGGACTIHNVDEGASCTITAVDHDANTITCAAGLAGGSGNNQWDQGEEYYISILPDTWISGNETTLENGLTAYDVTSIAYPGGENDEVIRDLVTAAGLDLGRGIGVGTVDYESPFSGDLDLRSVMHFSIEDTLTGGDTSYFSRVAGALAEAAMYGGSVICLTIHSADDYSKIISDVFPVFVSSGVDCLNLKDLYTRLTDNDTDANSEKITWSRTTAVLSGWDGPILSASSPCIDAGTDVGLSTDYRGRTIKNTPDIGAYESWQYVVPLDDFFVSGHRP